MNVNLWPKKGSRLTSTARHQRAGLDPFEIVVKMITIQRDRCHIDH